MHFDFSDAARPLFRQIAQQIMEAIANGTFAEGKQVPSTTEIAQTYQINPATVLKGMNLLVEQGLLEKHRGVGMFVTTGAQEKTKKQAKTVFLNRDVRNLVQKARQLGISKNDLIILIEKEY